MSDSKIESAYNFAVEYIEGYNKSTEAAEAIISCNRCAYTLTDEGVLLEELITNHNTRFSIGEK